MRHRTLRRVSGWSRITGHLWTLVQAERWIPRLLSHRRLPPSVSGAWVSTPAITAPYGTSMHPAYWCRLTDIVNTGVGQNNHSPGLEEALIRNGYTTRMVVDRRVGDNRLCRAEGCLNTCWQLRIPLLHYPPLCILWRRHAEAPLAPGVHAAVHDE